MTVLVAAGMAPTEVFPLGADFLSGVSPVHEEWNRLAAECDGTSYFQTADWVGGWWETVARQPVTRVACWRADDGSLEAIAAVSRGREVLHRRLGVSVPVTVLSGTGPGDADHGGPIARPDRRAGVGAWLAAAAGRGTLVAATVSSDSGIRPTGARTLQRTVCPRLALDRAPVGRSSNFRRQLGRFSRRLVNDGVNFEWVPPGSVEPATVDHLFALHQGLRRQRGQATSLGASHRELLLRCSERATERGGPAAVVASRDGAVVGVLLGFWWQGCFSAYQSGWDAAYASYSIGSVLVSEAIRGAASAGAHTFDFLRGAEAYKYRFGAIDAYDETSVIAGGPVGALVHARAMIRSNRRQDGLASRSRSAGD
jgi:CelD/BcsL family acetyltransferase involved in cellulose biosynthesis